MRLARIAGSALLAAALCAGCAGGKDRCRVQDVAYNGWKCVELSNGRIDVVVAPQLGGRIAQLRLDGFEYLWTNRDLEGRVFEIPSGDAGGAEAASRFLEWANYGGDKLWPAPQGWSGPEEWPGPPDPFEKGGRTDRGAYELEVLSRGPSEAAVRLTGPKDLYAGIRFVREIRIRRRSSTVELVSVLENISERPVRWGIWQVTQHDARAGQVVPAEGAPVRSGLSRLQAWAPVSPKSRYPRGYRVMFGAEDNPQFSVLEESAVVGEGKIFRLDYRHQVGKVGLDSTAGWLAVTHEEAGRLFAHTFPAGAEAAEQPDGATVEFWASGPGRIKIAEKDVDLEEKEPWLIESEVLSPSAKLAPGEKFQFASEIHLARGKGPVLGATGAAAVLEPLVWNGKDLAGKVAVFQDGRLVVKGLSYLKEGEKISRLSALEAPLGAVRAGDVVDLGLLEERIPSLRSASEPPGSEVLLLAILDREGKTLDRIPFGPSIPR